MSSDMIDDYYHQELLGITILLGLIFTCCTIIFIGIIAMSEGFRSWIVGLSINPWMFAIWIACYVLCLFVLSLFRPLSYYCNDYMRMISLFSIFLWPLLFLYGFFLSILIFFLWVFDND